MDNIENMEFMVIEDPNPMPIVLGYFGFTPVEVEAIMADGLATFEEVGDLDDKDITKCAAGFAALTNANGKIVFGMRRTNDLMSLVHWV